ncbi:MAG: hypothetical protein VXW72_03805, partial [Candidatus Thermoplasmatota archaeon]|nr:hypothetical protein [Candidatus Thermoplasmatota archaeon]
AFLTDKVAYRDHGNELFHDYGEDGDVELCHGDQHFQDVADIRYKKHRIRICQKLSSRELGYDAFVWIVHVEN